MVRPRFRGASVIRVDGGEVSRTSSTSAYKNSISKKPIALVGCPPVRHNAVYNLFFISFFRRIRAVDDKKTARK